MHIGAGVLSLLLGVPLGHRVHQEISQQELISRDLRQSIAGSSGSIQHKPPEYRLDLLLMGEDQVT
ncbi:hypothetical protein KI387_024412, partial [Taxus chinensis]